MILLLTGIIVVVVSAFDNEHPANVPAPLASALLRSEASMSGTLRWTAWASTRTELAVAVDSTYALNGDVMVEQLGDAGGWTEFEDGEPTGRLPQVYLFNADGVWHGGRSDLYFQLWDGAKKHPNKVVWDIRNAGLSAAPEGLAIDADPAARMGLADCPAPQWTETKTPGGHQIVAECGQSGVYKWTLDSSQGGNVVYASRTAPSGEVFESESVWQQAAGDIWVPAVVSYYQNGQLTQEIVLGDTLLEHNGPIESISPSRAGLEPGMGVHHRTPDGKWLQRGKWNGDRVVSPEEFDRQVAAGAVEWGPVMVAAMMRGGWFDSPYLTPEQRLQNWSQAGPAFRSLDSGGPLYPTRWRVFVEQYCDRFKFDARQRGQATELLNRCESEAAAHLSKTAARQRALRDAISEAYRKGRQLDADVSGMRKEIAGMYAFTDDLFKRRLRPGLIRLTSSEQLVAILKEYEPLLKDEESGASAAR